MAMKTGHFIEKEKLEKANFGDSVVGKTLHHVINTFDIGRNGYGVAILSRKEEGKNRLTYLSKSPRFIKCKSFRKHHFFT